MLYKAIKIYITALPCCAAAFSFEAAIAQEAKYNARIEIAGTFSSARTYGEVDILIPIFQKEDMIVFFNGRGMLGNKNIKEGNIGFGFRKLFPDDYIVGLYGFYDVRKTELNNQFSQFTFGAEYIRNNWEVRANSYLPRSNPKSTGKRFNESSFLKNNGIYDKGYVLERALKGFDGEIGGSLPSLQSLRFFVGGYHFYGKNTENITGPRARAEWHISDSFQDNEFFAKIPGEVSLNAALQHDAIRGTRLSAEIRFKFSFGGNRAIAKKRTYLKKRMTGRIIRDADIITGESYELQSLLPENTKIWYVKNNLSTKGDGTIENPFTELKKAESSATNNDIIYIYEGDGTSKGQNKGIILKEGQKLLGSAGGLTINGRSLIAATNGRPILSNSSDQGSAIIEAHNNITISSLNLKGENTASYGIRIQDKTNITIENLEISRLVLPNNYNNNSGGFIYTMNITPQHTPDHYWTHSRITYSPPSYPPNKVAGIYLVNSSQLSQATKITVKNTSIKNTQGTAIYLNIESPASGHEIIITNNRMNLNQADVQIFSKGSASGNIILNHNNIDGASHITFLDKTSSNTLWDVQINHNKFSSTHLSLRASGHGFVNWTLSDNRFEKTKFRFSSFSSNHQNITLKHNLFKERTSSFALYNSSSIQLNLENNIWQNISSGNALEFLNSNGQNITFTSQNNNIKSNAENGFQIYNERNSSLTFTSTDDSFINNGFEGLELDNFYNSQLTATIKKSIFQNNGHAAIITENEGQSNFTLNLEQNQFIHNGAQNSLIFYSANTAPYILNQTSNIFTGDNPIIVKVGEQVTGGLCFNLLTHCINTP